MSTPFLFDESSISCRIHFVHKNCLAETQKAARLLYRAAMEKKNRKSDENIGFTDFYPWNVYFGNTVLSYPTEGFAVWHINGMVGYRRSIRLSLSEYMGLSARVRSFLHKEESIDDFNFKNQNNWKGYNTWLHIIFNNSVCIFGLYFD